MTLTTENLLLIGSILLLLSILASKTTGKLGVPALIIFLAVGMLAGSDGIGGIHFDNPNLAQSLGAIALTFILFSGGLETKWESVKPVLWQGVTLSTLGVLLTAVSLGFFISYISGFTLTEGLLIGAIVSSTDAAAVFSILRSKSIGLKGNLRPLLELESGSNDPMAYFLTIGITSLLVHKGTSFVLLIPMFFQQMIIGAIAGYLLGKAMIWMLNKINLDHDGLYPVLTLALIFFTYGITTFFNGNGFLAVYLSAIILGNENFIHKKSIIRFYDGQAWMMQIVMFLALGLLVFPKQMLPFIGTGSVIALFLMFVARPLAVFLCLLFFKMRNRERLLISWVGLRGAVPIVFATYPLIQGVEKSEMIFNIVFFIVLSSVMLQGTTIPIVAKWLYLFKPVKFKTRYPLELELSDNFKNELFEVEIKENSNAIGRQIFQLKFPKTSLIVLINRSDKYITPSGTTTIVQGDKLLIMSDNKKDKDEIEQVILNYTETPSN
ncbi:potassium/proton antiporter [Candidatus Kuenenia sp.]|uniref:potassium/proton antiporter n=1 Tax=Candidatus Kuenenia sp. TaxID=2499824 RepID=UPI003220A12F